MKCPHCKKARWPIKDENGNFIWINFLKIDIMTVLFIIVILFLSWAYQYDTEQYQDIRDNPGDFCDHWCSINNQWGDSPNDSVAYGRIDYNLINFSQEKYS